MLFKGEKTMSEALGILIKIVPIVLVLCGIIAVFAMGYVKASPDTAYIISV